ncbi:Imm7 family immunity protein [Streptomyces lancefieldiae]|uniref:Imm7 family immunity protein n=1 Tax=Streptomyces lancefieldiae TaxID=3075520 RepID=A0ABU3ASV5_9ACTN|nr:Imm7 family immunity protein [Streptomyces sp. DSM 40712]MDT0612133.1 Imm7 family immunity protein [Streptomyces sp. DSM 40712]
MFEYHGSIAVRDTAADDDDEPRLQQIVDELRLHIAQPDSPYLLDLGWIHGEPFVHLGGISPSPLVTCHRRTGGSVRRRARRRRTAGHCCRR